MALHSLKHWTQAHHCILRESGSKIIQIASDPARRASTHQQAHQELHKGAIFLGVDSSVGPEQLIAVTNELYYDKTG